VDYLSFEVSYVNIGALLLLEKVTTENKKHYCKTNTQIHSYHCAQNLKYMCTNNFETLYIKWAKQYLAKCKLDKQINTF